MGDKKLLMTIIMMDLSFEPTEIEKIDMANRYYSRIISNFQNLQEEQPKLEIKIATMIIGKRVYWLTEPLSIEKCKNHHFKAEGGNADYKAALSELNAKLRRNHFMAHSGKVASPFIALITDNISFTYCRDEIDILLNNGWFINSSRTVGFVGKTVTVSDRDSCKPFVTDSEDVLENESEMQDFRVVVIDPGLNSQHDVVQPFTSTEDKTYLCEDDPFTRECGHNPWANIFTEDKDIW